MLSSVSMDSRFQGFACARSRCLNKRLSRRERHGTNVGRIKPHESAYQGLLIAEWTDIGNEQAAMFFEEFDVAFLRRHNRCISTFELNSLMSARPAEHDSDLSTGAYSLQ